jgi:hypothetical protein
MEAGRVFRRNDLIFDDVLKALEAKRSPVILTERRDHLSLLQARSAKFAKNLAVLHGGMSAAERRVIATVGSVLRSRASAENCRARRPGIVSLPATA